MLSRQGLQAESSDRPTANWSANKGHSLYPALGVHMRYRSCTCTSTVTNYGCGIASPPAQLTYHDGGSFSSAQLWYHYRLQWNLSKQDLHTNETSVLWTQGSFMHTIYLHIQNTSILRTFIGPNVSTIESNSWLSSIPTEKRVVCIY